LTTDIKYLGSSHDLTLSERRFVFHFGSLSVAYLHIKVVVKQQHLHFTFKNLTTYLFPFCKFNMVYQLIPQPENWCYEGFLSVHCCVAFWCRQRWIGQSERVSCTVVWNVQEAGEAGTKLALYVPLYVPNTCHQRGSIVIN